MEGRRGRGKEGAEEGGTLEHGRRARPSGEEARRRSRIRKQAFDLVTQDFLTPPIPSLLGSLRSPPQPPHISVPIQLHNNPPNPPPTIPNLLPRPLPPPPNLPPLRLQPHHPNPLNRLNQPNNNSQINETPRSLRTLRLQRRWRHHLPRNGRVFTHTLQAEVREG